MTRPTTLTSSHADVDVAIARIERFAIRNARDWCAEPDTRRDLLADLLTNLTVLFNVEDQFGGSAAEMFGAGLPETVALSGKRGELLSHIRALTIADEPLVHLGRLRDTFDEYTVLQWRLFRTYDTFLAPGTGGV